ncbi:MAG: hypothetical protein OEL77_04800 [Nitrosopumilus sp.]|nr:hypothetical protein [Nitrosopumilus sp.]MDH3385315.1 hypothetical protein [Nitrosopumilus sp.]
MNSIWPLKVGTYVGVHVIVVIGIRKTTQLIYEPLKPQDSNPRGPLSVLNFLESN